MTLNPAQIELTPEQKAQLASIAERSGKDYRLVVDELLSAASPSGEAQLQQTPPLSSPETHFTEEPSLYNELAKRGILGCFEGPSDLATNPKHMEGFGRSGPANTR